MVKKLLLCFLIILFAFSISFAETHLEDDADIFTIDAELEQGLKELSEALGYPVYILTTDKPYGADPLYAVDMQLMERVGKNQNGLILGINMESRDITVTSSGPDLGEDTISDGDLIGLRESVGSYLSDGEYNDAARHFISKSRDLLGDNYISIRDMMIAALASFLGVGSYGFSQTRKYNPKPKRKAFPLYQNSAIGIEGSGDLLVDTRRIVRVIPKNNNSGGGGSTSHSSGGGSFRGSSGKF